MGTPAKVLAPGEVRRLQARAGRGRHALRKKSMVLLSFNAGLRACEIAGLDWTMVLAPGGRVGPWLMIADGIEGRFLADLISREFDGLVTVDPHLYRYRSLDEIDSIPTNIIRTSEVIGTWVREHVSSPVIFGPDAESAQWVEAIAASADCPWSTFQKERHGDRSVQLIPPAGEFHDRTPVLVDDIISSGVTMIGAARILAAEQFPAPYCIAVHALFDASTGSELRALTRAILTTDTIAHPSSQFRMRR